MIGLVSDKKSKLPVSITFVCILNKQFNLLLYVGCPLSRMEGFKGASENQSANQELIHISDSEDDVKEIKNIIIEILEIVNETNHEAKENDDISKAWKLLGKGSKVEELQEIVERLLQKTYMEAMVPIS